MHFFALNLRLTSLALVYTCFSLASCSSSSLPHIRRSSTITFTPSISANSADMWFWNTSGADFIPKGNLVNRYLPNGVLNVQSFELASSNFTCQYPEVASRTENTFALGISTTTSSILVTGRCSLLIASFKSRGSMHMRSLLGFTTATMLFTQSVGSFYLTTTSAFSIRSSSSLVFSFRETGTVPGVFTWKAT